MIKRLLVLSVCVLGGQALGQNLVSNGGFESVTPPLGSNSNDNYRYMGQGNSLTIGPWTVSNDGQGEPPYVYNSTRYPTSVFEGVNSLDLNQGSGISQLITLEPSRYYCFSATISSTTAYAPLRILVGDLEFQGETYAFAYVLTRHVFHSGIGGSRELRILNENPPPDYRAFDIDDIRVQIAQRIYGRAYLGGYLASVIGELLEVQVWQGDTLVETLDGNYGPNGTFAFSPTVNGAAVLKFRFRTGLWKAVPVTLGTTPIENLTVNMTNGDCDHDNEVGIGDYALLSSTYGLSVSDPGYDTNADLNGDTTVDIADYAILSANYGEVGD